MDGPGRDGQPARDLGDRQVTVVAQGHDDSVVWRQRRQGSADDIAVLRLTERVARCERNLSRDVLCLPPGCVSQAITAGVDEDPIEPLIEAPRVAQGRPLAPRLEERIVGRVLSLAGIAEDDSGKAIGGVEVAIGQEREGPTPLGRLVDLRGPAVGYVDDLGDWNHIDMTIERAKTFTCRRVAGMSASSPLSVATI